jgi:hypothetical protein
MRGVHSYRTHFCYQRKPHVQLYEHLILYFKTLSDEQTTYVVSLSTALLYSSRTQGSAYNGIHSRSSVCEVVQLYKYRPRFALESYSGLTMHSLAKHQI